jgi:hypothetical protein
MKWEVKLYQGGSVFTEEVYANDYQDAKATAQARNPTVKIIGCNPVFDKHDPFEIHSSSTSSPSSTSSSGSNMSLGDMGGMLGLFAVLFVLWLIIEYWMWILPITLIGAILYYFGTKEN